ncbi:MAG: hypothetical protein VCA36_00195 [Opitutales bacterium]
MKKKNLRQLLKNYRAFGFCLAAMASIVAVLAIVGSFRIAKAIDQSAKVAEDQVGLAIEQLETTRVISVEMASTAQLYAEVITQLVENSSAKITKATRKWNTVLKLFASDVDNARDIVVQVGAKLPIELPTQVDWGKFTVLDFTFEYPKGLKDQAYFKEEAELLNAVSKTLGELKEALNETVVQFDEVAKLLETDVVTSAISSTLATLEQSSRNLDELGKKRIPLIVEGLKRQQEDIDQMRTSVNLLQAGALGISILLGLFAIHAVMGAKLSRKIAEESKLC